MIKCTVNIFFSWFFSSSFCVNVSDHVCVCVYVWGRGRCKCLCIQMGGKSNCRLKFQTIPFFLCSKIRIMFIYFITILINFFSFSCWCGGYTCVYALRTLNCIHKLHYNCKWRVNFMRSFYVCTSLVLVLWKKKCFLFRFSIACSWIFSVCVCSFFSHFL